MTFTYFINHITRKMPIAFLSLIGLNTANFSAFSKSYFIRSFSKTSLPNVDPSIIPGLATTGLIGAGVAMLGFRHSVESKVKMSAAKRGNSNRKGCLHSEETKAKIKASQVSSVKIEVTDLETKTTTTYNSIREAARALSCNHISIRDNINSKSRGAISTLFLLNGSSIGDIYRI